VDLGGDMIKTSAPVRFSLLGGGSDLPEYYNHFGICKIISMTLNKRITVIRISNGDGYNFDYYGEKCNYSHFNEIPWDYVKEPICFITNQYERYPTGTYKFQSDITTKGTGLGASSSFLVAFLKNLDCELSPFQLFRCAVDIERNYLNQPCGIQDHAAAVYGGVTIYTYDGVFRYERLSEQGSWLAENLVAFKLPHDRSQEKISHVVLKDMKSDMINRAWLIKETTDMIPDAKVAIEYRDIKGLGVIIHKAWELKKKHHNVGDSQIDQIYNHARNNGALAGKVSGSMSGGAGVFFFIVPEDKDKFINSMAVFNLERMDVGFDPDGVLIERSQDNNTNI